MNNELHIQIRPETAADLDEILEYFPFQPGQSILSYAEGVIIVDLAGEDDSSIEQDWFLNSNEDVLSFFVVEE